MKKIKSNVKFIAIIIAFLILPLNINAAKSYEITLIEEGKGLDIREFIDEETIKNDNIIICAYTCSEENDEYCQGQTFSSINYNHNNSNTFENWYINVYLSNKLVIDNALGSYMDFKTRDQYKFYWSEFGNTIPYSGIYFESSDNKNESWKISKAYKALQTSFECPKYMYFDHSITDVYDKKNNMELCYANEKEQCMKRNEEEKTTFGKANELTYSFKSHLSQYMLFIVEDIKNDSPQNIFNPYFDTKNNNMCEELKQDSKTFASKINKDLLNNNLNERINEFTNLDPVNSAFYNYENLTKLFNKSKSKNQSLNIQYNDVNLTDRYNSIELTYLDKIEESINYYKNECNMVDESNVDVQEVKGLVHLEFEKIVSEYQKIEFTELNCDNIFADIADIIKTGYFVIELIAILLVVVLTIVDYAQVILSDNQDEMKKSNKKLTTRLVIIVVILLLPALINMVLKLLHIQGFNSEKPLCVEIKNK